MKILQISIGPMANFAYLVSDGKKGLLIDPGFDGNKIMQAIEKEKIELEYIICTHEHYDHVSEVSKIKKLTNAKVVFHKNAHVKADILVDEKTVLKLGNKQIKFIYTPGHSPGSMCVLIDGNLFSGDTLFVEGAGRVDLPGSSESDMIQSMDKIKNLPDDVVVWPGHDYGSEKKSTVGKEKKNNPHL